MAREFCTGNLTKVSSTLERFPSHVVHWPIIGALETVVAIIPVWQAVQEGQLVPVCNPLLLGGDAASADAHSGVLDDASPSRPGHSAAALPVAHCADEPVPKVERAER